MTTLISNTERIARYSVKRTKLLRRKGERGASIVEFAIILPVFLALVLGGLTGAAAYNRKLSLVSAAREGTRLAATLPVSPVSSTCTTGSTDMDKWLNCIKSAVVKAAGGDLGTGGTTRYVCVAYYNPTGATGSGLTAADDQTSYAYWDASDTEYGPYVGLTSDVCDASMLVGTERQVQVVVKQSSTLQVALASTNLTLTGKSVSRYERVTS